MYRLMLCGLLFLVAGCESTSTTHWLELLRDKDVAKRRQAARELGDQGIEADRALPALSYALHDEDASVRREAALSLGKFGSEAKAYVPALVNSTEDDSPRVREAVRTALRQIAPERAER